MYNNVYNNNLRIPFMYNVTHIKYTTETELK